jgi:hypothetical protein
VPRKLSGAAARERSASLTVILMVSVPHDRFPLSASPVQVRAIEQPEYPAREDLYRQLRPTSKIIVKNRLQLEGSGHR